MPGYDEGYRDGYRLGYQDGSGERGFSRTMTKPFGKMPGAPRGPKPKRKLSAWNKYVKANSKKPRFRYRNGKLNLKKMAVAFRKTPAGKKKRR